MKVNSLHTGKNFFGISDVKFTEFFSATQETRVTFEVTMLWRFVLICLSFYKIKLSTNDFSTLLALLQVE